MKQQAVYYFAMMQTRRVATDEICQTDWFSSADKRSGKDHTRLITISTIKNSFYAVILFWPGGFDVNKIINKNKH